MFLVKANTVIQVPNPKNQHWYNWNRWRPYTTSEDRWYDKHEVFDAVALLNGREMPDWMRRNIHMGWVILQRRNHFAMLRPAQITFVD